MLTELSPESFPRQEERVLPCSVFPGDPLAQPLNHSAGQPRAHAVNVNSLFWQVFKHCLTGIRFIFPSSWPSQPKLCFFSPLLGQLSCASTFGGLVIVGQWEGVTRDYCNADFLQMHGRRATRLWCSQERFGLVPAPRRFSSSGFLSLVLLLPW